MKEMKALKDAALRLAHTGENEAVRVAFSLAPFEEAFPGGRPALLVRRKGDAQAYPVTLTVEGDTAYWTVTAADTAAAGFGQCELQWYAGDTLAKSDKFDFLVVQALEAGAEPPDAPSKRWFDAIQSQIGDLNDLTTKARENLVAAINEAAKTGSGGAGSINMQVSGGYIQYSTDGGATWENLIAVAGLKGEPGEDGAPGKPGEKGEPGNPGEDGKDGAGMDITGAAAGQIAKISAVDENGVPTAWEPVDMPSGGEEWEELGTVDMSTADVVQLTFDSPVKKILIAAIIKDSGYTSANSSNFYRTLSFKVGDEWRPHNFRIGASNHSWSMRNRIFFDCGVPGGDISLPAGWGVRCSGIAGEAQAYGFPLHNGNNQQYITGCVSGVRLALTKPADTENTVTGAMKVWGIKA